MKKKWIAIIVSLLIIALIGLNVWKNNATTTLSVETATLSEEVMIETVMTPGTLKLHKEQYVYYQQEKGEIAEVFVKEGQKIKAGDELVRYENKQLEMEKKQNDLQIRSIHLQLDNLRKQHREIDKALEKDEENEMLEQEHDQIKLQEQMTNIELEQANLQKESIDSRLEQLIVTAEVDGTVLTVNELTSSEVLIGEQSIIRIGSLNDVIVEGTVSEYDTLNIAEGQQVILTSDVVPDDEWLGKVSFIGDLPEESISMGLETDTNVLYPIEISIEDEINLKPGFKMLIEIVTSEEKVQTLPVNAIQQEDDVNFVYVVKDGKAERVEVKIGSVDSEKMEIKEGVTEEDEVIISPSEDILDGTEVTVK